MVEPSQSIAVMPFRNLSPEPDTDYFARGFVEDLIANLTRFPSLRVVASQSTFEWDRLDPSPKDIAREWDLQYVLEGSVRCRGSTLRVSTQLIRTEDRQTVWADRFDAALDDVFAVQDEITATVAGKLAVHIDDAQLERARRAPLRDLRAYDCWLRGLDCLRRGTLEGDEESRPFFERALQVDPSYARAYSGLSVSHFNEWTCQAWHLWDDSAEGAFRYAARAAELDETDAMVQAVLARVCRFRHQHGKADAHGARALALNPNDAEVLIHVAIATLFNGEPEQAHDLACRAVRLSPLHPPWYLGIVGWSLFMSGRITDALPYLEKGGETIVNFAAYRAACLAIEGELDHAREEYDLFEREYREKIAFGRAPKPGEALRWAVQVEPFRRVSDSKRMPDALRDAGLATIDVEEALATRPDSMVRPAGIALPPGNAFRREGRVWNLAYESQGAQLVELKGFHDIARLLGAPDEPVHCLELSGAPSTRESRQEVLDARARHEYGRRIEELQGDLERADADNDPARADGVRLELDTVIDELAKAAGLGGRSRAMAADAERARSATTWRIRSAIRKIRAAHPRLGQHLENSIRTGAFCVYAPETPLTWVT
ncbi:MAG: tetratricopeptide repeat protein [Planctomycetota bacterium]|jgi:TolB-like protein/tetratricopeptide (TPR) repeat protein